MPYSGADDENLPDYVKKLSEKRKRQWVEIFNSAYEHCMEKENDKDGCEESAFRQANGVVFGEERMRKIKNVESWDGSASRWPDTESYCADCLIDVNAAAGRTEKVQSHCMLPIRGPDDDDDTYVRQAVHAAAAGRGIHRVQRPDDVPADAWERAVRAAARKLVRIYREMDEEPPESIVEMARAISLEQLTEQITLALEERGLDCWLHDIVMDDGQLYVVVSDDGRLWRYPVRVRGDAVELGEAEAIALTVQPRTQIIRQADGRVRWLSISCTAFLNRVGEIDSTALFDDMIRRAYETDRWPERQIYHLGSRFRTGQVDGMWRDGVCLITTGVWDDSELARAEIAALEESSEEWGESIRYKLLKSEDVEIEGVQIPVCTAGEMIEVSLVPAHRAAALYTRTIVRRGVMRDDILNVLRKLFKGDEEKIEQFAQLVDEVNERASDPGMIARAEETADQTAQVEAEEVQAVEIDDAVLDQLVQRSVEAMRAELEQQEQVTETSVAELRAALQELQTRMSDLEERIAKLEQDEETKMAERIADLGRRQQRSVQVTYRPRQQEDNGVVSLADIAQRTLRKLQN